MYNNGCDSRQTSELRRYINDITACKIVKIDDEFGLEFELPWGGTSKIKPGNFEIEKYEPNEWVDVILYTVSGGGSIALKSVQFIGKTPGMFVPKE